MENASYSPDLPISLERESHKIFHHHLLKSFGANYPILKILKVLTERGVLEDTMVGCRALPVSTMQPWV